MMATQEVPVIYSQYKLAGTGSPHPSDGGVPPASPEPPSQSRLACIGLPCAQEKWREGDLVYRDRQHG